MKRITAYRILGEMEDSTERLYQLVDQVAYCECENYDREKVLDFVNYLIANGVVPVIRCKDCMHYSPYEGEEHKGDCLELVGLESCVYEDDFCSYAKPKARDEE